MISTYFICKTSAFLNQQQWNSHFMKWLQSVAWKSGQASWERSFIIKTQCRDKVKFVHIMLKHFTDFWSRQYVCSIFCLRQSRGTVPLKYLLQSDRWKFVHNMLKHFTKLLHQTIQIIIAGKLHWQKKDSKIFVFHSARNFFIALQL
jgi:hypothetical protein